MQGIDQFISVEVAQALGDAQRARDLLRRLRSAVEAGAQPTQLLFEVDTYLAAQTPTPEQVEQGVRRRYALAHLVNLMPQESWDVLFTRVQLLKQERDGYQRAWAAACSENNALEAERDRYKRERDAANAQALHNESRADQSAEIDNYLGALRDLHRTFCEDVTWEELDTLEDFRSRLAQAGLVDNDVNDIWKRLIGTARSLLDIPKET